MWNVKLNGSINNNAFGYDTMGQEDLHHSGRNAIVVVQYSLQLASFAGCEEALVKWWIDKCKVSMSNHTTSSATNCFVVRFKNRLQIYKLFFLGGGARDGERQSNIRLMCTKKMGVEGCVFFNVGFYSFCWPNKNKMNTRTDT